jgi:type I restriction-modification system DNA methylase subunit
MSDYNKYVTDDKTRKKLGQFWTPAEIIIKMMDKIPEDTWKDPTKTFLDPTMGSGNIIIEMLKRRINEYNIDPKQALQTTYGIEIDVNTYYQALSRISDFMANYINVEDDEIHALIKNNFVCSDIFEWDIEKWQKK